MLACPHREALLWGAMCYVGHAKDSTITASAARYDSCAMRNASRNWMRNGILKMIAVKSQKAYKPWLINKTDSSNLGKKQRHAGVA